MLMIVTAMLTTGVARVCDGESAAVALIDEVLSLEHKLAETWMSVGDVEFLTNGRFGPFPNHRLRISVDPLLDVAALNYIDHSDREMAVANSYNPHSVHTTAKLIFDGDTGARFPDCAVIPRWKARAALIEWINTRRRPTCIDWQPYDVY